MPEIAELARVRRPVVTIWRRRHVDSFPRPAGGDAARPLFDAREIADWLVSTGRADPTDIYADLYKHTISHLGESVGATELIAYGTALICLRFLDDEPLAGPEPLVDRALRVDPTDRMLLSEIREIPAVAEELPAAIDELIEAAWGCRPAFNRLLADRNRLGVAELYRDAIAAQLGRLVAAVSGVRDAAGWQGAVRVVDPWAGTGDLVSALLEEIGEEGAPLISASAPDEYLTRLLRRRLTVWGIPAEDQHVVTQDATRLRHGEWDVLVARLQYRAAEKRRPEPDLAVLRDLARDVHDGRCAVVLTPADLLDRLRSGAAATRAEILRTGKVEAIVSLPGGLLPFRPGYRMAMWVLREDESGRATGRVMLADISDRTLTARLVDDLAAEIITWRREGFHPAAQRRSIAHPVAVAELVGGNESIARPRRPETTEAVRLGPSRMTALIDIEARITRADAREPAPPLRSGVAARDLGARRTVTIGTLLADRRLTRISGTRLRRGHLSSSGHHRVIGIPEILGASRVHQATEEPQLAERHIDRATLASNYPGAILTEPGDVVVALAPRPIAIVDEDGFSVVEFPASALRVSAEHRWLTPRVLAALVTAAPLATRASTATRGARLDQLHLPDLDDAEIAALDDLLAQVDERRMRAREQLDMLDALCRNTLAGLADGTLTISAT